MREKKKKREGEDRDTDEQRHMIRQNDEQLIEMYVLNSLVRQKELCIINGRVKDTGEREMKGYNERATGGKGGWK